MKRITYLLLGFAAAVLLGVSWNSGYEASPAGTDLASDLDIFIQSFKREIRQHLEVEHIFGGSTDDNGLHTMGSARCFAQNTAPTDINSGTAALGQYNSAASADGGTALTTDEVGATTRDIGAGRCWVDLDGQDNTAGTLDDYQMNIWNEATNAFVPVTAVSTASAGVGANNLIYNGSFEITDGTGNIASTSAPAGWTNLNTADISYNPTVVSEGTGYLLITIANGGNNEGVTQALVKLKASTTYVYRVRVEPNGGTCNLNVDDGTTTATDTSAAAPADFETLEVQHTTTAVPGTVNVNLRSTAAGDECHWEHVTVYERNAAVTTPGIQVCYDTDNSVTPDAYTTAGTWVDALVSCSVVPPGPGYIVQVRGQLVANNDGTNPGALAARIREGGATTRAMGSVSVSANSTAVDDFRDVAFVPVFYTRVNPTPGVALAFTLEGNASADGGGGVTFDRNLGGDVNADFAEPPLTTLEVTLIPTR